LLATCVVPIPATIGRTDRVEFVMIPILHPLDTGVVMV
jgi:hypothetical protein